MKIVIFPAVAIVLGACTTITPITAKDGKPAQLIECRRSISECHVAAQELCKGAYLPLEEARSADLVGAWNSQGGGMGTARRFELTVRCQ